MLQLERKLDSNFIKHSMLKWYGATAVQAVLSIFFLVVSISAYLKKTLTQACFVKILSQPETKALLANMLSVAK